MESKLKIPKDLTPLCYYCFEMLDSFLSKKTEPAFPSEFKGISCPLFVTWKIGKEEDLRGCIGTFTSESLESNLPKYALISSLQDTRFTPITKKEFPDLHVGVSLLTDFEDGKDAYDWEVGTHGIQIFYKKYNATFLPEVAAEQNWDKYTTLEYLLRKSGCRDNLDKVVKDIKLTRYQSKKESVSYEQYIKNLNH